VLRFAGAFGCSFLDQRWREPDFTLSGASCLAIFTTGSAAAFSALGIMAVRISSGTRVRRASAC
jgi:hypothetical protein